MHMHVHVGHLSAWFYKTCQLRIAYLISETPGVIFTLTILLALKKKNTKKTKKNRRTIGLRVLYLLLLIFMKGRIKISLSEVLLWITDYDINVCSWPPPLFASAIFNLRFPFLLFIITTWPWRYCWFAKNSVKWLQLFIE